MPKIPMTISLPKELYAALDRLATLQGASKSSLIVSVLEPALPTFVSMADLIEHLQNATPEQRAAMQQQILQTEKDALEQLQELTDSTGELND